MTSPGTPVTGPQTISRGAVVDNAPVLALLVVGIGLIGASAGWSLGEGEAGWILGGLVIGLVIVVPVFLLTLRHYKRVDVDLGAGTLTSGGRTVALADIDQLHVGPANFGFAGRPGVHMAFGIGEDVVAPVYLRGAPLRQIPRPQAQLLAEAMHRTSAAPAADAVEALVAGGFIDRPAWHQVPAADSTEGIVRYLLVGPLTGRPDEAGLARVAQNLGLPVEALRASIAGDVGASADVTRALAEAGIRVEMLQSPGAPGGQGSTGGASGDGARPTDAGTSDPLDPAVAAERARAVTLMTTGNRDLAGVTADDLTLALFEYVRLLNPAGARRMLEGIAAAPAAKRDAQLAQDEGLRRLWERYGHEVSGT